MCIACGKTFSLVPRSRSSVTIKVSNQGELFVKKNGRYGDINQHFTKKKLGFSQILYIVKVISLWTVLFCVCSPLVSSEKGLNVIST